MKFSNPGDNLTRRNRFAQLLMDQPNINNGSTMGGLAHVLRQGLAGYMIGKDSDDRDAANRAMSEGMSAKPWINPDTGNRDIPIADFDPATQQMKYTGQVGQTTPAGGYAGAAYALSNLGDNEYAARYLPQMAMANMDRQQGLEDEKRKLGLAMQLKAAPGAPNSPTRRPASGIQYKMEYDRIKAGPGGQEAADNFVRQFVNQSVINLGDRVVPRADAFGGGNVPSATMNLKPGEQPETREAQAFASAVGAEAGASQAKREGSVAALPRLEDAVETLKNLGKTATYTLTGQAKDVIRRQAGMPASEGAKNRAAYIAHVKNNVLPLLRLTFGAAFTVAEGDSLLATFGDPDMSPGEKDAVLDALISDKRAEIGTLDSRAEQRSNVAPPIGRSGQIQPRNQPMSISSDDEYNALPSGTVFIDPDGKKRVKP